MNVFTCYYHTARVSHDETDGLVSRGKEYCQEDQKDQIGEPADTNIHGKKKMEHFGIQLEDLDNKQHNNQEKSQRNYEIGSTSQVVKEEAKEFGDSNYDDFKIII